MPADFQVRHAATVRGALAYVWVLRPACSAQFVTSCPSPPSSRSHFRIFSNQTDSELPATSGAEHLLRSALGWRTPWSMSCSTIASSSASRKPGFLPRPEGRKRRSPRGWRPRLPPWRDDLRPCTDSARSLYDVYMGLWRFWAAASTRESSTPRMLGWREDQLARSASKPASAWRSSNASATLISLGRELINEPCRRGRRAFRRGRRARPQRRGSRLHGEQRRRDRAPARRAGAPPTFGASCYRGARGAV